MEIRNQLFSFYLELNLKLFTNNSSPLNLGSAAVKT